MRLVTIHSALFALLAACGGVGGPDYTEPFATLHGQILSATTADLPDQVHVSLVWEEWRDSQQLPAIYVAQELAVTAEFPAQYQLDITSLPPEGTLDEFGVAVGHLLVYDDVNGDGHIDMTPSDAPAFEDRLLGYPSGLQVFYDDQQGFHLEDWRDNHSDPPSIDRTPVALDASIDISLVTDPRYNCYLMDPQPGYDLFPELPADDHDGGPFGPFNLPVFSCPGNQPPAGAFTVCVGNVEGDGQYHFQSDVDITPSSPTIAGQCGELTSICDGTFDPANPPHFDVPCM